MSSDKPVGVEPVFEGAGSAPGLLVFRVEKLKVAPWPKDQYSQFYTGDAYIILHTYKKEPTSATLYHRLHFWLGKDSSQDEQGTAAYMAVVLDDMLGGAPVQYREVQGHESQAFRDLFPRLVYLQGGIDSGFHNVKPEAYKPHLLQIKGKKHPQVTDVPLAASSLNDGDVFVLDAGLQLYQWNGTKSNIDEKREATALVQALKEQRHGKPKSVVLDGLEDADDFWKLLGGKPSSVAAATPDVVEKPSSRKVLLKVSDASGAVTMTQVATEKDGAFAKLLTSDDVFIVDATSRIWVYVGKNASAAERRKAIEFASEYVKQHNLPATTPITRVSEAALPADFEAVVA